MQDRFRKDALRKLTSPDKLDELLVITKPKDWLVVFALIVLITIAIFWGIYGQINVTVRGTGVLLNEEGLSKVQIKSNGRIDDIFIKEGDTVHIGQELAIIENFTLMFSINNLSLSIKQLKEKYDRLISYTDKIKRQKKISSIEYEIKKYTNLNATNGIKKDKKLIELQSYLFELKNFNSEHIFNILEQLPVLERELIYKKNQLRESSIVISPYNGIVTEIMLANGNIVENGSTLLTIENAESAKNNLITYVYVHPREGKRIKAGMNVFVNPSTINKEEYGYICGKVSYVSQYPATEIGMLRVLGNNKRLVNMLTKNTAPIVLRVELLNDSSTFSGYKWTSQKGPESNIVSGTISDVQIIIEKKSPLSYFFPVY